LLEKHARAPGRPTQTVATASFVSPIALAAARKQENTVNKMKIAAKERAQASLDPKLASASPLATYQTPATMTRTAAHRTAT